MTARVAASDRTRLYGLAGKAAGEAALEHGLDGARVRSATDAFLLSRIARAVVDAIAPEGGTSKVFACAEHGIPPRGPRIDHNEQMARCPNPRCRRVMELVTVVVVPE